MLLGRKCPKKQTKKKTQGKSKESIRNDTVFRIVTAHATRCITIFDGISVLQKVTVSTQNHNDVQKEETEMVRPGLDPV